MSAQKCFATHNVLYIPSVSRCLGYFSEGYGGGGGGDEPRGLEGEVCGPGSTAHEVQSADHQDPRAHSRQGWLEYIHLCEINPVKQVQSYFARKAMLMIDRQILFVISERAEQT